MSNLLSSHTNFTPKSIYCKNVYKDCDETSFGLILLFRANSFKSEKHSDHTFEFQIIDSANIQII